MAPTLDEEEDELTVQEDMSTKQVNYLVGILEEPFLTRINDKVRCFIYEETKKGGKNMSIIGLVYGPWNSVRWCSEDKGQMMVDSYQIFTQKSIL